jgi:hypothetical protein
MGVVAGGLLSATSPSHGQSAQSVPAPSPLGWAGSLLVEPASQFEKAARSLLINMPGSHVDNFVADADKATRAPAARAVRRVRATYTTASRTGHPSLPLGTMVRVTNPRTGRHVVVRIGDRCTGCQINLSLAAAKAIGFTEQGVGTVEMAVIN